MTNLALGYDDLLAFWVTIKLALVTTFILIFLGTPLAWWLAKKSNWYRTLIEALVAMPLVLPPTVLGFYLLVAFSPQGPVGQAVEALGLAPLAFTFAGLVVGSVIYSTPFVVQPLLNTFQHIGRKPLEAAATLGASPIDRFFSIVLPMAKRGFVTALTLGFAHTLGEFGVVLMIGGNIPGETQVLSIAIYSHVEALEYSRAHLLSAMLILFSLLLLLMLYRNNGSAQVMPNEA